MADKRDLQASSPDNRKDRRVVDEGDDEPMNMPEMCRTMKAFMRSMIDEVKQDVKNVGKD